ncbi:unnamed protein product [Rotaria sordida]|uniref:Poly [ADP-ribose] polymerase n=1 Tax=Rotaria sordida TaxID=392033 RepID=A0A818VS53_9BILA|nr:unnamed protein product [Rotaria sordida]CAF0903150.1 unnamed protein product [Rotaria sordida]CAF3715108.1 unnamed protein product [Rotaria sordida]CAF4035703.1 unnamed protein product [Rotaria sordida]
MAEAIEENAIHCENCNTQVSFDDWSQHSRECVYGEKSPIKESDRNIMNESNTSGIPCEYCNAQISVNDWQSHLRQCIDEHGKRIEKLKDGIHDDSIIELIPCEYCDKQINIHDLEYHSRQCANTTKRDSNNIKNNENASMNELIPCEYCDKQINIHDWEWHSRQCANATKRDSNHIKNNENVSMDALIPCEYCGDQVNIEDWSWHTEQCQEAEKQRIENRIRQNALISNDILIPCEICKESFPFQDFEAHQTECQRKQAASFSAGAVGIFPLPDYWDQSSLHNLSRYILQPNTEEYKFVADNFHKTLPSNQIVQIERIQNRRWYRQYDAHKDDFIERYGTSTEQWLFHGCKSQSVDAIISDCFNRSHAVRCAAGQGIYFATQASTSLSYTQPDSNNLRHMFMARVLIGKTTAGSQSTRVCPPGFDTTGGGTMFVTYHDAQAYGEYLIVFR